MSEAIEFVLPEPPAAFLERLSRYGADWRDSRLPPLLRAQFVIGFRVQVSGEDFTLAIKPGFRGPQAVCVGSARADAAGCRVTARTVPTSGTRRAPAIWFGGGLAAVTAIALLNATGGRVWWSGVGLAAIALAAQAAIIAAVTPAAVRRHDEAFRALFGHLRAHRDAGSSATVVGPAV